MKQSKIKGTEHCIFPKYRDVPMGQVFSFSSDSTARPFLKVRCGHVSMISWVHYPSNHDLDQSVRIHCQLEVDEDD